MSNSAPDFSENSKEKTTTGTQDFLVMSYTNDSWQIRLSIPSKELVDQEALLFHLRKVKAEIAQMYAIEEAKLSFGDITRRDAFEDYVEIVVSIYSQTRTFGEPRIIFRPDAQGHATYLNMAALLDLAYLDEHKQPITFPRVMEAIDQSGVDKNLLDSQLVTQTVQEVLKNHTSVSGVVIARGRFPLAGQSSEIKYNFPIQVTREDTANYLISRQVTAGDVLCQKTSLATEGIDGNDVLGKCLPASSGQDIELQAGVGTQLAADGLSVTATASGIVTVANTSKQVQTLNGAISIPATVQVKVNQLTRITGDKVVRLNSSDTIEVTGNLHAGSSIVTEGEVIISGSVHNDTTIEAVDSIAVNGTVQGATLNSQNSIIARDKVESSRLIAREQIITQGDVRRSELTADTIQVEKTSGSTFIAEGRVSLLTAEKDEDSIVTSISVGVSEFLKYRIKENNRYIDFAKSTLNRLEMVFGSVLVAQANRSTVQILFMRFLAQLSITNMEKKRRADTYRLLIQSIPPIQLLMKTKQTEIAELLERLDSDISDGGVLDVRDRLNAPVKVNISGQQTVLQAGKGPLRVRKNEVGALVMDSI